MDELVTAQRVRVAPNFEKLSPGAPTPFSGGGAVRALDAQQVLRAGQVGALFDSRLEVNTYSLLLDLGRSVGPWVGAGIAPAEQTASNLRVHSAAELLAPRSDAVFEKLDADRPSTFLDVREADFVEEDATGETLASATYEHVLPKTVSTNTAAAPR